MSVTLEPCEGETFVARAGADHHAHGDPYDMACTIECVGAVATAKGLATDALTRDTVRDLCALLRARGYTEFRIERSRVGGMTERVWDIR